MGHNREANTAWSILRVSLPPSYRRLSRARGSRGLCFTGQLELLSFLCYILFPREISKEDFDLDINSMQKELDNLKDILSGQITLDSTLVSSLFNVDDGMPNM